MESFGGSELTVVSCTMRKKRSTVSRRPRPDSRLFSDSYSALPFSLMPPLGSGKVDENGPRVVSDGLGSEKKLRKLKLKVGGVTRTVHTKSTMEVAFGGGSSAANSSCSSVARQVQQPNFQEDVNTIYYGLPNSSFGGTNPEESNSLIETYKYEPARKSRRVPKRRNLDVGFNDEKDEEIRYLERLNASKIVADYEDEEREGSEKKWRSMKASRSRWVEDDMYANGTKHRGSSKLGRDKKKNSRSEKLYEDNEYFEEEPLSDDEFNAKKKPRKDSSEMFIEGRNELTLLTRKRASESGASLIDLPNGLPPAPPRKQKEKLSEVEQQLKKVEVAQRRKMQSEKAAREAEADAIRKILGQDSSRKKKEDKMKKRRDELAEGKAASNFSLASNTVRWVLGPTGTVVTFSDDIGLPNIFNQVGCSYPQPREKCVGPNCTNVYKYRDSKSKLPLCSLICYKAIK